MTANRVGKNRHKIPPEEKRKVKAIELKLREEEKKTKKLKNKPKKNKPKKNKPYLSLAG
jgi:hypothetical protein